MKPDSDAAGSTGGKPPPKPGTIGHLGLRLWLYPKEIQGFFTRRRTAVAWVLLLLYLGLPWISWKGEPLFRLNIFARRAELASHYFWPQDLSLLLPAILAFVVVVFLVTARWGRVFCGWACPQTVFLQFLFYPVEVFFEGKAAKRKARDQGPLTWDWAWRKTGKHLTFALMAFVIANTALAYLWGRDALLFAITHPSEGNAVGLAFVVGFSAVFYWVFAYFREQACVLICPYARFQSVLADAKTTQVTYDFNRGEPRGRRKPGDEQSLGDCVDCNQCVLVCPTGIDIRNGTQLECIGCARCIDACDQTMTARKWPTGLIRYATLESLTAEGKDAPAKLASPSADEPASAAKSGSARAPVPGKRPSKRILAYALLATALASVSLFFLARRPELGVDLVRQGQEPYLLERLEHQKPMAFAQDDTAETVVNRYTLHLRNRRAFRKVLRLRVELPDGSRAGTNWETREFSVAGGQLLTLPLEIRLPPDRFERGKAEARILFTEESLTGEGGWSAENSAPPTPSKTYGRSVLLAGPWGRHG